MQAFPDGPGARAVRAFLEAMERRDLEAARRLLAPGFRMTFPGGAEFETLEALLDWAAPRYRWVRKAYERFDEIAADGGAVVYCYGTLYGAWPDGRPFSGIRFIDRFVVADGLLREQMVWNDMAEVLAARAAERAGGRQLTG